MKLFRYNGNNGNGKPGLMVLLFLAFLIFIINSGCSQKTGPAPTPEPKPSVKTTPKAASSPAPVVKPPEGLPPFTIIYTSNMRGNALPSPYKGVSKTQPIYHFSQVQEIIRRLKSAEKNPVFLVDAGDSLHGDDDFSSFFNGEPMVKLMEAAGYDAVRCYDRTNMVDRYPFMLNTNDDSKGNIIVKKKINGKTIVFISEDFSEAVFSDLMGFSKEDNSFKDLIKKEGGDYNVLITYSLQALPEYLDDTDLKIDLIIVEAYNDLLNPGQLTLYGKKKIPVVPYVDSRFNVGKIEVKPDGIKAKVIPAAGAEPIIAEKYLKILRPYIAKFKENYRDNYNTVISSAVAFGSKEMKHKLKTMEESPTADFIADCMIIKTAADVAIINHFAIRKDFRGIISSDRISEVLPFDNEIVTMDLTGEEIVKILSSNAREGETFFQVSGIKLGINPDKHEVIAAVEKEKFVSPFKPNFDKEPHIAINILDPKKVYRVATIDYLLKSDKEKYNIFEKSKNVKYTGLNLNYAVFEVLLNCGFYNGQQKFTTSREIYERILIDDSLDEKMMKEFKNFAIKGTCLSLGLTFSDLNLYKMNLQSLVAKINKSEKIKDSLFTKNLPENMGMCLSYYRSGKSYKKSAELFQALHKKYPEYGQIARIAASFPKKGGSKIVKGTPQWRTFGNDSQRKGRADFVGPKEGKIEWKFKTHHTFQSSPAIAADGTIICAGGDGILYAIKPEGVELWKVPLGRKLLASPTISDDGVIYVGSDNGNMNAVDLSGKVLWKYRTGKWVISTAVLGKDGTIYFGSNDHQFYALTPDGKLKWNLKMPHEVFSSPAIDKQGNLIVGCKDKNLYSISPKGEVNWKFPTKGIIYSTPAIADDDTIVFGSDDHHVYALTPRGKLKWKFKTGGFVPGSPAIDKNGSIYVGSEDNFLYCLNPNGEVRWKFKTDYEIFGSPAIDKKGSVFFGSDDSFVYGLSPQGKMLWKVQVQPGKYVESSPAISKSGRLYIGADDMYIYSIK